VSSWEAVWGCKREEAQGVAGRRLRAVRGGAWGSSLRAAWPLLESQSVCVICMMTVWV
jgi:hypothetical protein